METAGAESGATTGTVGGDHPPVAPQFPVTAIIVSGLVFLIGAVVALYMLLASKASEVSGLASGMQWSSDG